MKKPILTSAAFVASVLPFTNFAQERPNIVLFLVDDMGVMDTSVEFLTSSDGVVERHPLNDWYQTPSMERLSESGVRFSRFYAQSVSSPSRTSLMTGQNSTRHGTTNWINSESNNRNEFGPLDWNWSGITSEDVTLSMLLQQVGYRTIHIGKAHFGPIGSEGEEPCNLGFDINIGGSSIGQPGSYLGEEGYGHIAGNKSRAVDDLEQFHGTNTFLTDALTIEAKRVVKDAVDEQKPFFLNLAHYALHAPFYTDERFIDNYPSDAGKSDQARAFATLVEGMDKSLGDLLDYLEELGIAENTLIIFLGDNGSDAPLGSVTGHTSSAPLRGIKGSVYEGGVRVPFIASWAKVDAKNATQKRYKIASGEVNDTRSTIMDIFPTVLEIADVENPKEHIIDGSQLWKLFKGKKDSNHSSDVLLHFPHDHRGSYFTTYIEGDWKLIYYYNPQNPEKPKYELYNLNSDPYEKDDLSLQEGVKLAQMVITMAEKLKEEGALPPIDATGNKLYPALPI
ncbi:MAG: sulfatase [Rikenellaceae bacterium]